MNFEIIGQIIIATVVVALISMIATVIARFIFYTNYMQLIMKQKNIGNKQLKKAKDLDYGAVLYLFNIMLPSKIKPKPNNTNLNEKIKILNKLKNIYWIAFSIIIAMIIVLNILGDKLDF